MLKYDAGRWLQIHTCLSYEYSMMLCINTPAPELAMQEEPGLETRMAKQRPMSGTWGDGRYAGRRAEVAGRRTKRVEFPAKSNRDRVEPGPNTDKAGFPGNEYGHDHCDHYQWSVVPKKLHYHYFGNEISAQSFVIIILVMNLTGYVRDHYIGNQFYQKNSWSLYW